MSMSAFDDAAVVPTESFESLASRYRGHLNRAAMALAGNGDDAADLVQETLIRAFRYFHNFEPGSNFRAWVLRILHNTHISQYRHRRRSQVAVAWEELAEHGETHIEDDETDSRTQPEFVVLNDMPEEEVQRALDSLPENFRQVIELADLCDHSYAEIGDLLGLPIGTVRSRLFRARHRLRGVLSDYAVREGFIRPEELDTITADAA